MGIDLFLEWDGQNEERDNARAEDKPEWGSLTDGHVGYLREAYHGGPYATKLLAPEAFESDTCRAEIPAATLRKRLTTVTRAAEGCDGGHNAAVFLTNLFQHLNAPPPKPTPKKFNLVSCVKSLFGNKEQADAQEKNAGVALCSPLVGSGLTPDMSVEDAVRLRNKKLYNKNDEQIEIILESFRDFVALAERKEAEFGKPCTVYASY